jgi:type III secretion protein J
MQEKIRYQAGLAEQIASTIRKIDGVLDADVQISFPDEDPLNPTATKQKITGSVYVKHSGVLDDPNAHLITRIKRLVSGSVNGLDFDNVTVIGDKARYSSNYLGIGGFGEEDPYVNVWTITIAKSALNRFRIIFFSFTISILVLLIGLIWVLWKISPILQEIGGMKQLLTTQQLVTAKTMPKKHPSQTEAQTETKEEDKEELAQNEEEEKDESPSEER